MEHCPDKEALEKFTEQGLNEEMSERIFSHLSLCNACRGKVDCLLAEERGLLKSLLSKGTIKEDRLFPLTEKCIPRAGLLAYVYKCLSGDQVGLVELHLRECNRCLTELMRLQKMIHSPTELDLELPLPDTGPLLVPQILSVIVEMKDNILNLISHSGELLFFMPELGPARGKPEQKLVPISVRKDFPDRDFSMQVTINRSPEEDQCDIAVAIMKLSSEEFISGVDIALSDMNRSQSIKTDIHGVATFYGFKPGSYDIKYSRESFAMLTIK